jgi:GNAT superfamily N-acetyltransferase
VLHADNSHLGVGWFGIPDTWPRVLEAFAAQGYEREGPWRILTGPVSPPIFEPPAGYSFRWSVDERTREWDLEAYAGEERAGDCSAWGMPPQFDSLEEARRWISIEWIGVEKEHRRRGLGRALLSEQMKFHKARGEQLILWTEAKNEAALRMFTGLGLVLGPTLWPMKKLLG